MVACESQNTVLDDNKKLCLVSGDIIQMSNTMTMMFEVEDLAVASPATVSRCGMIYMEPHARGFEPLVDSYIQKLTKALKDAGEATIRDLFWKVAEPSIRHVKRNFKQTVATTEDNMVLGLFSIMDSMIVSYVKADGSDLNDDEKRRVAKVMSHNATLILLFNTLLRTTYITRERRVTGGRAATCSSCS
jgi:dynein heavy chain